MLEVANTYEVEDVKERCEECLLDMIDEEKQNPMSVLRLLHLANENNLPSLKSKCMERADWKILDVLQENDINLSSTSKKELDRRFMPVLLSNSYIIDFLKTSTSSKKSTVIFGFLNAKGFKTRCNVCARTYTQTFKLFDKSWNLKVGGTEDREITFLPWLIRLEENPYTKLKNNQENIPIGIACTILNHMPNHGNCSTFKVFTIIRGRFFYDSISWNSANDMDIKEGELLDGNRGFSLGGKYDIEVYILMNKPESVKS